MVEAEVRVTGRVQGVGFRPFVYRLAVSHGLRGYVINLGDAGVEAVVEGSERAVESFIEAIKTEAPPVSEVSGVYHEYRPYRGRFRDFRIDRSRGGTKVASGIFPPDIGICPDCLLDMEEAGGRWHEYPFTACAWCGPRFTAVRALPYDRERTHMAAFPMCDACVADYRNPLDRRFDAQGITCSRCGPKMSLHGGDGKEISVPDVFAEAARLLSEGRIVAVKGIGGFHLASLATEDAPVAELRRRKRRPEQPFALMSSDLDAVRSFAKPTLDECHALESWRKPIVLVRRREGGVSELVAPGLDRIGVMLPYTGIQVMLFKRLGRAALVMTSGNRSGLPMVIDNSSAYNELSGIADYYLVHDRDIVNRCDDSLVRINGGRPALLRRSRGYVPDPVEIPIKRGISFSLGTELNNSAAVALEGRCYLTQYLGDVSNLETVEYEKAALYGMRDLLRITRNPDVIGCDEHPGYLTSHLAGVISHETEVPVVKSQHHHAHVVSACAENGIEPDEEVVGVALDGAGYGPDGSIWGGEVLISTYSEYERVGHLQSVPMPGGDLCAMYPYRMLVASLTGVMTDNELRDITKNHVKQALPGGSQELDLILKEARGPEVLQTTSSGRFLDSVAALIGLCYYRSYEGEPAMKLETMAEKQQTNHNLEPEISDRNGVMTLNIQNMLKNLLINENSMEKAPIASLAQDYLAEGFSEMATRAAKARGIRKIALSGGVLANERISTIMSKILSKNDLIVLMNEKTPIGDGGAALGQICYSLSHVI